MIFSGFCFAEIENGRNRPRKRRLVPRRKTFNDTEMIDEAWGAYKPAGIQGGNGMMQNIDEAANRAFEIAKAHESQSGVCSQGSIAGIFETLGVENDEIIKAATALADGVGLTGDGHCGALSGGTIAIGHFFGRERKDFGQLPSDFTPFILAKKLHDQFVEKYGTCRCADVQKHLMGRFYNLYDPADLEAAINDQMMEKCSNVVGEAARMATRIILEAQQ
jgi:C_GCAxxG_C_C family probable redox protein